MTLIKLLKLIAVAFLLGGPLTPAFAQSLQWDTPVGLINLNLTTTEALVGYDAVVKQAIGGFSLPIWTDPMNFVAVQVGATAPWPIGNAATVQPYVAAGHDLLREIPSLNQYQSLHLNVFGEWVASVGKAGAGIAASYSFAGPSIAQSLQAAKAARPTVRLHSPLNLVRWS